MLVITAVVGAFLLAFVLVSRGTPAMAAWLLSCLVVPAAVLFAEFVLPYAGGGASMWPIALVLGGVYGGAAGAAGTLLATFRLKRRSS
jgi:hypothetical protein